MVSPPEFGFGTLGAALPCIQQGTCQDSIRIADEVKGLIYQHIEDVAPECCSA
jgi:hypothetical protein